MRSLPRDAALVLVEIQHGTTPTRERVGGTRERPLHMKEGLARLIEELYGVLVDWEDDVRHQRAYRPRGRRPQGVQIESSTRFLLGQFEWIMARHPYVEATRAFGWEMNALHRKVQKFTHQTDVRPTRCVGVRCPGCGWKALIQEIRDQQATGYVLCENCSRLLNEAEYRKAVAASLPVGRR